MFGRNKQKLRRTYDDLLLADVEQAKVDWDNAKLTQKSVYDADDELEAETKLAKAKYQLLFREARLRRIKGHLQASLGKILFCGLLFFNKNFDGGGKK